MEKNQSHNSGKRHFSLRFSLSTTFAGIALLTAALLGTSTYLGFRSFVRDGICNRLGGAVGIGVLQIDGDLHAAIQTPEDETKPEYLALKQILQGIRNRGKDIRFVYTMRQGTDGKLSFVVDAEEDPEEMSHVGDPYEEVTPSMAAAFEPPFAVHTETEFGSDKWGVWLSSYAPIYSKDGKIQGILGIDMSAEKVVAYERKFLATIAVISLLVAILVTGLGFYFSFKICKPLTLLQNDMQKIQRFELETGENISSRVTEVVKMKSAVDNMKNGLKSFKKYVPSELVADLIRLQKEAILGAEKRDITILFSDIADFTGISEKFPPEQLAECLGDYFRGMTTSILKNRGTVDKFIGDAIMAFWSAPNIVEDHALKACQSALQCQAFINDLARQWNGTGKPIFATRIGINTGEAIVGNMGYEERMSYTAIGDNVNLASRLEGLNKYYETRIIIGENTYEQVKDKLVARLIDVVAVKGKKKGIRIYELMADKLSADPSILSLAAQCDEAMEYYLQRKWSKAVHILETCVKNESVAKSCRIILERCCKYEITPPADDWCGVIFMRDK